MKNRRDPEESQCGLTGFINFCNTWTMSGWLSIKTVKSSGVSALSVFSGSV
jgi:hypothetical protein